MTVSSQNGILSFGMQTAKGTLAASFYRHKADDIDLGAMQRVTTFNPEVGGQPVPTGVYKVGAFIGGGAVISPRLKKSIGYLLKGLMGDCTTVLDTPEIGANTHTFTFLAGQPTTLPWMTFRKYIPGASPLGEIYLDCKLAGLRLAVPQGGLIQARVDVLGREFTLAESPAFTYVDPMEDETTVPISTVSPGFVKLPGFSASALPITAATINMVNNHNPFERELIVGSPFMDDVVPLTRAASIEATLKWADPDLYQAIYGGSVSATAFSHATYLSNFSCKVLTPTLVVGTTQFSLACDAARVAWTLNGAIRLTGARQLEVGLLGTVLEPPSGEYLSFTLVNDTASYA